MTAPNLNEFVSFIAVARERSFTRAAAKLGVTRSALSHAIKALEARLGVRLLTRTTRSVSPTSAGERLVNSVGHHIDEIETELESFSELRDRPVGTLRINTHEHALHFALLPALSPFLAKYPDIHVEVTIDYGLTDIVAERFDAGVRTGGQLAKDMIAVRIGPDMRMAVIGSPAYFATRRIPLKPKDLTEHNCINLRLPTHGGLYVWEFEKGERELRVRVEGQFVVNGTIPMLNAALAGVGLAYVPEDLVKDHVASGTLVRVLENWCAYYVGYHLYYPSRRQHSPAFALLVDALRYRK